MFICGEMKVEGLGNMKLFSEKFLLLCKTGLKSWKKFKGLLLLSEEILKKLGGIGGRAFGFGDKMPGNWLFR